VVVRAAGGGACAVAGGRQALHETGDVVVRTCWLPDDLRPATLIAVPPRSYCYAMSNGYNRLPRPAVVAVRDRRIPVLLRRRPDDLFRLEAW